MSLPVGTIVKLLNVDGMVGSLGTLYQSIESLSSNYFQANLDKNAVLKPRAAVNIPLLPLDDAPGTKVYKCNSAYDDCTYITECKGAICDCCDNEMVTELSWIKPTGSASAASSSSGAGGYVKGVVTYMVMDNLEVKPLSTISGITMINKLNVRDVSCLVEKEVEVGSKEGLAMLKASMVTNAVLTNVFIGK